MRSISSTGRSWKAARPALTEPIFTPSTSTSTWSDSLPRMNSVVFLPGPPLLLRVTPGTLRSSSGNELAWLRSMASRSITVVAARLARTGCSLRVAVTTCSSSSRGCGQRGNARDAENSQQRRPRGSVSVQDRSPSRHPRDLLGDAWGDPMRSHTRPVSGLASGTVGSPTAPSHAGAQWLDAVDDSPTVAGQRRILRENGPASLFHPGGMAAGT